MPRKRTRGQETRQFSFYIVQITGWDWSYSFGINAVYHSNAHYNEYRHLHIQGTLLLPRRIKEKTVKLVFLPHIEPEDIEGRRDSPPPRAAGSLTVHRGALGGNLAMSKDALGPVLQMLLADRFKYVVMNGERMRYRRALIGSYRMETEVNVEDYPDD